MSSITWTRTWSTFWKLVHFEHFSSFWHDCVFVLDALALLMSCREANLLLALLWLARIDLLVVVCVCLCVYGGTGICGQPFLQYPLCQSYVIFRLSQKACSFVGLCFFTVFQLSVLVVILSLVCVWLAYFEKVLAFERKF